MYPRDVFICHASTDKDTHTRVLDRELRRRGLSTWVDEAQIQEGQSLIESVGWGLEDYTGPVWTRIVPDTPHAGQIHHVTILWGKYRLLTTVQPPSQDDKRCIAITRRPPAVSRRASAGAGGGPPGVLSVGS